MNVLVDTPVWSLALRRKPHDRDRQKWFLVQRLADLVGKGDAQMIGVGRQDYSRAFARMLNFFACATHYVCMRILTSRPGDH